MRLHSIHLVWNLITLFAICSVVLEVMKMQSVQHLLEPILEPLIRRVVSAFSQIASHSDEHCILLEFYSLKNCCEPREILISVIFVLHVFFFYL